MILNLDSGMYYGLDAVGTRIWNLVQSPRIVKDLCDTLLEEYEVEPVRCDRDLMALLRGLAAEGLVAEKDEMTV